MRKILTFLLFVFIFPLIAQTHASLLSAGGNVASVSASISYSVGQVMYKQTLADDYIVSSGVQLYLASLPSFISKDFEQKAIFRIFPSVTDDFITMEKIDLCKHKYTMHLYNLQGVFLKRKSIESNAYSLSLINYPPGVYFLKIYNDEAQSMVFRIIKR